jgi:pimeloyl-ACP methyl ester carboxylesterase
MEQTREMRRNEMPVNNSIFTTPENEKHYLDLYDTILAQWKIPSESLDVTTQFGTTHINASGSEKAPAMLLLPGFGANSSMWYPNAAALSDTFRVYAVDTNGQPGRSLPSQKLTASNSSDWITEVLDGLGIQKAHLVGVSLGGWLALNFAIHKPGRTARVVLLDPAASFEKMSAAFLWHSFLPIMLYPTRAGLIKYFRWMTQGYLVSRDWGELMLQGILNTRPQPPLRAVVFTDSELRSVKVPVQVLIGGKSVIYDPQRACRRARQLIPGVQAEIIPDASHAINAEKAELVNDRILKFCTQ